MQSPDAPSQLPRLEQTSLSYVPFTTSVTVQDPTGEVMDATIASGHPIIRDVSGLKLFGPCKVDPDGAKTLVSRDIDGDRRVYAAVERPGTGGDVVIVGDFQFFDDTNGIIWEDNEAFIDNLAAVAP